MRILISGSTGLIGRRLMADLEPQGHELVRLVRGQSSAPGAQVSWDPNTGQVDLAQLEAFDVVVHLAGDNIASGRWTEEKKKRIRDSRVIGTRHLAENIARLKRPPKVCISSSAIGYYGDRGETPVDELAAPGSGFLADVCREWEAATQPAAKSGARVVQIRTGVVLEGLMGKMKVPFLLGLGGRLGDGKQYMSWISLEDICGAIRHAMATSALEGPVNGVAPKPVTNDEFTRAFGRVIHRPTLFPVPKPAARLLLGEMSDALLFASQRILPTRLSATGYAFRHPDVESGLRAALGK